MSPDLPLARYVAASSLPTRHLVSFLTTYHLAPYYIHLHTSLPKEDHLLRVRGHCHLCPSFPAPPRISLHFDFLAIALLSYVVGHKRASQALVGRDALQQCLMQGRSLNTTEWESVPAN